MQATKSNKSNNFSTWTDFKPKGKVSTFNSSPSKSVLKFDNIQQSFEMLKISLKKETDRRNKFRKLLEKYNLIYTQEKKHVKQIKSSIIEMKDANATAKFKIFVDPTVLVENSIKVQTREFLCALMNTFYQTYEQNQKNSQAIANLNGTMSFLIKGISYSQDMLFLMQKSQINEQVQLQGQLLTQKNLLKQQAQRHKQIKQQHSSVLEVYTQSKQKNTTKKQQIQILKAKLSQLNQQSHNLIVKIEQKQNIKNQCQDKIDTELFYQQKLQDQVNKIDNQIGNKKKEAKKVIRQLFEGKVRVQEMRASVAGSGRKNRTLGEQARHQIKFQILHHYENIRG